MNAPVADIVPPSHITVAAIAIAQSVRRALANAGSRHDGANCSPRPTHVVFTLPPQLAALALQNKKVIYGLLLRASAETLLEVARNPTHLGAEIGFFSVLHTWNQKLQIHPHVHCVVPAGGLSLDHTRWIRSHPRFFLPIPVLRTVFRGKFVDALKLAFQRGQLHLSGSAATCATQILRRLAATPVSQKLGGHSKPPFGARVCAPVSRSLHSPCRHFQSSTGLVGQPASHLSLARLRSHNEQKLMTLALDEFLRVSCCIYFQGFVRIRHFGFLANRRRSTLLPLCFAAWVRFPSRSNPKPLLKNRTLFGAAPSVADQWRSSNDLLLRKSNSVLHLCWSQLRHETARPQLENSARLTALRPRPPCSRPDPYFPTCIPAFSTIDSPSYALDNLHLRSRADSRQLQHLFLTPFNLHKARVRRASGFLLTAFSNATPHTSFSFEHSSRRHVRKSTSVTRAGSRRR